MRVSLFHLRVWVGHLGPILLPGLVACAGGDLLLPDDRAPAQLRAVSGDGQSAVAGTTVPHPLVVEALDRAGRPVEGAVILFQFVDPPDGAVIAPAAPATDPEGRAAVEVTLGRPAGDQPVDARLTDPDPDRDLRVRFLLTAIQTNNGGGGGGGGNGDDPPPDDGGGPPDDGGGNGGGGGGGGGGGQVDDDGGGGNGNGGDEGGGDHDGKGKGKGKGGEGGNNGNNGGGNNDSGDED